jgi:sulfotransferase family protein
MLPQLVDSAAPRQPLVRRLPGLLSRTRHTISRIWRRLATPQPPVTVLHVTHYKAGSQWVRRILEELAEPWVVVPRTDGSQFLELPVLPHRVYPTLYVTRQEVERTHLPAGTERFIIIRDLRDTLISAYFSLKVSHNPITQQMSSYRAMLGSMRQEDGLIRMIRQILKPIAAIQRSWLGGADEVLKYEDLLVRDEEILSRVLLDQCQLPSSRVRFRQVVASNRFEALTGGRKPGAEDLASHERKGVAGDWRNYFTDRVARTFKDYYGALLIETGYEHDDRW